MINPSSIGWINKFFVEQKKELSCQEDTATSLYKKIRNTGYIYGHIVSFDTDYPIETKGWTSLEMSKIALINTLFSTYVLVKKDKESKQFISKTLAFYNEMNPVGFSIFKKVLPNESDSLNLEKIIDSRVQTTENSISKNFSHIVTNALLFVDVLAFHQYLLFGYIPEKYLKKIEETIISIISLSLKTKLKKTKYDDLLIKLFEASVRYSKFSSVNVSNLEALELDYFTLDLEKFYLIDLAGMALWSDGVIEENETYFLHKLGENLSVSEEFVIESIASINTFLNTYKHDIPYFNYSNPVKHFYDQTTQNVEILIGRNKNRLFKEISESKELMVLLAASTRRELDEKEKKKIKKQVLDICKSIPSLTIFLLPGGSLLLPILIKFIPKLLPSAFNENLED